MQTPHSRSDIYQRHHRELVGYARRLVVRDAVAEELVQEAAVRLLQNDRLPDDDDQIRAWLFRVVSNLAIDHLRRHSTWRELVLIDTRGRAEADAPCQDQDRTSSGACRYTRTAIGPPKSNPTRCTDRTPNARMSAMMAPACSAACASSGGSLESPKPRRSGAMTHLSGASR